jgi:preprotein translocase subunit SecG
VITYVLIGVHVGVSGLLVLFILLHSGKGTGLSDMFGGGGGSMGAGGAVERNLDRITIAAAIVFTITTVLLGLRLSA